MASSSVRETKGFEIQTRDIRNLPKRASLIEAHRLSESIHRVIAGCQIYKEKISEKSLTQRFDVSMTSFSSQKIKYR